MGALVSEQKKLKFRNRGILEGGGNWKRTRDERGLVSHNVGQVKVPEIGLKSINWIKVFGIGLNLGLVSLGVRTCGDVAA